MNQNIKQQKQLPAKAVRWTLLLFVACCMSVASAFAQDVITLKNGEQIEALVQEVGDVNVKYKRVNNPDGPNYLLKKSEIFMIRYANGSKDLFSTDTSGTASDSANTNQRSVQNQPNPPLDFAAFSRLRDDDDAMEAYLKANDAEFYDQFHRGASLRTTGKVLFGTGLGLTIGGLVVAATGLSMVRNDVYANSDGYYSENSSGVTLYALGVITMCAGQALIITSIPLSAVGGGLKKNAANGYADKYYGKKTSMQPRPSLNFQIGGNGVGFALRF